jgi:DNA replication and repair protein RecF
VILAWLELQSYRSYEAITWHPDAGLNVLIGRNGAGKTNILEAIAYLSSLKSFRSAPDSALVMAGAETAVVRGGFRHAAGELRVEVELPASGRRRVLLNGKRPQRFSDVAATVPLVAFLPDDLDLVKRGPAGRRDFLDDLGARLAPTVGADLAEYERVVRQRNRLLREEGQAADPVVLSTLDEQVARIGGRVLVNRLQLIHTIAPALQSSYQRIGGSGTLEVRYRIGWDDDEDATKTHRSVEEWSQVLTDALRRRRVRDMDQRTTTAGPHRDDPGLRLDGRDVRVQASQGEQRSAALSMRLASYATLEQRHDRAPLLLLDDVLSELDGGRGEAVMELLPRGQVFVTSAREDEVPLAGRRWQVDRGALT